jgi:hypothetical protein
LKFSFNFEAKEKLIYPLQFDSPPTLDQLKSISNWVPFYYCACYIATLGNNNPWSLKTVTVVIFFNGMMCVGIPKQEKTVLKYLQFNIFFIF